MIFRRSRFNGSGGGTPREDSTMVTEAGPPPFKPFVRPADAEGLGKPFPTAPRGLQGVGPAAPRRVERPSAGASADSKKLIVGREISLNGRISACDRLVVEGQVEAELNDGRMIEIADAGLFRGTAKVDGAEISGRFEGSLTVRERLVIRSTGRVMGTIRYGRIEIEVGGEINGDVKSLNADEGPTNGPEQASV